MELKNFEERIQEERRRTQLLLFIILLVHVGMFIFIHKKLKQLDNDLTDARLKQIGWMGEPQN